MFFFLLVLPIECCYLILLTHENREKFFKGVGGEIKVVRLARGYAHVEFASVEAVQKVSCYSLVFTNMYRWLFVWNM